LNARFGGPTSEKIAPQASPTLGLRVSGWADSEVRHRRPGIGRRRDGGIQGDCHAHRGGRASAAALLAGWLNCWDLGMKLFFLDV